MDLNEAKEKIYDDAFLAGRGRRKKALQYLSETGKSEAVDILAEALEKRSGEEKGEKKAASIRKVLLETEVRPKIDRMWEIWAEKRTESLESVLMEKKQAVSDNHDLHTLCLLKLDRVAVLGTDRPTAGKVSTLYQDSDPDVKRSIAVYTKRLQRENPDSYLAFMLLTEQFDALGNDRPAAEAVLPYAADSDPAVASQAADYFRQLPPATHLYVDLKTKGIDHLPVDREQAWKVAPYFSDGDPDVVHGAEQYLRRVRKEQPDLANLLLLKIGRVTALGTDRESAAKTAAFYQEEDADVKKGFSEYSKKIQRENPDSHRVLLLLTEQFDVLGKERNNALILWPYLKDDMGAVATQAEKYFGWISPATRLYVDLKTKSIDHLPVDREQAWKVAPYFSDGDPDVVHGAEQYLRRVRKEKPDLATLLLLKMGRVTDLATDIKGVRAVLAVIDNEDMDVQKGVLAFAQSLPDREETNEELYDAWIRTESGELARVIGEQKRLPATPAKEALHCLVTARVETYRELKDEKGAYFLEAYRMASDSFREQIKNTVIKSGDNALRENYRQALILRADFRQVVSALKETGDEDGLFEAARKMDLPGLLDLCDRWDRKAWLPQDENRRKVVETSVQAYKTAGKLTLERDDGLPPGVTDLFTHWKNQNPGEGELREGLKSQDPFIQARSAYLIQERGGGGNALDQMAGSEHWPVRLVMKMLGAGKPGLDDHPHLKRVGLLTETGMDGELLTAKVECGPDVFGWFQKDLKAMDGKTDPVSVRRRSLLQILTAFQAMYSEGAIVVSEDDSAEEAGAIEAEDVSSEELADMF